MAANLAAFRPKPASQLLWALAKWRVQPHEGHLCDLLRHLEPQLGGATVDEHTTLMFALSCMNFVPPQVRGLHG